MATYKLLGSSIRRKQYMCLDVTAQSARLIYAWPLLRILRSNLRRCWLILLYDQFKGKLPNSYRMEWIGDYV
jgi:hypothetical protein